MSAYALPGLFPPLPLEYSTNICISSSCGSERVDYVDFRQPVTNGPRQSSPEVEISVKDAKINALQLIEALTNKVLPSTTTTTTTTTTSQQTRKRGKRRKSPTRSSADISESEAASPQELAMQFELDVSYHGHQYTLIRSLYRMRLLCEDLVKEQNDDELRKASDDSFCLETEFCSIPELPVLQENGSCSNQSFSFLQALLRSYAPALECWLQKVFRLVSTKDSPTLKHFLLEPVCFLNSGTVAGDLSFCIESSDSRRRYSRKSSLESIEELLEEYHDE